MHLVCKALLRRGGWASDTPSYEARLTKPSFADKCIPKLELRNEVENYFQIEFLPGHTFGNKGNGLRLGCAFRWLPDRVCSILLRPKVRICLPEHLNLFQQIEKVILDSLDVIRRTH